LKIGAFYINDLFAQVSTTAL